MESRAELRCRSDLLAKCHWISLYPTPNTERTERWSAGRQVMSSAHFMIDTAQLSELNFHLCAKSSLACWRLNESFILSSYKLQLDSPWTFFFVCCITFTIMSTDILLKSQQSISKHRGPSFFAWSSLWAPFLLKCLDLQWHEKSAGDADGNLSCPVNTASPLGHAT